MKKKPHPKKETSTDFHPCAACPYGHPTQWPQGRYAVSLCQREKRCLHPITKEAA